jgi:aminoglycoside phosphotransferase (APT) family kinase protein
VSSTTSPTGWISRWPEHAQVAVALPDLRGEAVQAALLRYLQDHLDNHVGLEEVRRTEGGFSSETWLLDLRIDGGPECLVLRRQASVGPLEPYDLAREVGVLQALRDSRVPVPAIRLFCPDGGVIGAPFVLMERIAGAIPDYRNLPELPRWSDPAERSAMGRRLVQVLAAIQAVDWRADPQLSALLPLGASANAPPVLARVEAILAKLALQVGRLGIPPVLVETAAWLHDHAPRGDEDWVLVHGDYRVGNFVWRGHEIVGVLDWEGAGIGDPLEDLGYACHPIMRARAPELMAMLVPLSELTRIYERELGRTLDLPRLHYYLIYALYFHLHTFVTGMVAAVNGADLRVGLGYAKLHRVSAELIRQMQAFEKGHHAL